MNLRRLFQIAGLAVAAFLLFLSSGFPARAAENIPGDSECGPTTKAAIANAEKALASNSTDAQTGAMRCLIEAVKLLDAAQPIVRRGADQHEVLHLPELAGGPEKQ